MEGKFIIYQILLRVFANTNRKCVSGGSLHLNGSGKFSDMNERVLESLRKFGATHIWYTGIIEHATATPFEQIGLKGDNRLVVKGEAGSPYAIKDYYDVNPYLADNPASRMEEFEAMVERTHKAGLKVILDFVPNHLSRVYGSDVNPAPGFGAGDDTSVAFSAQNNFYYLPGERFNAANITDDKALQAGYSEFPAKVTGNDCFTASPGRNDWYETVKLNYGVDYAGDRQTHFNPMPKTWKMMLDILLYWCGKGADGFRCDMAEMVPVEFWEYAIKEVKRARKDVIFIAEIYNSALYREYLEKGRFDYLYVGNPFKAIPELAVSLLLNKAPFMLYFGQEVGERGMESEGYSGVDGRTSIFDYCSAPAVTDYFEYLSGKRPFEALDPRKRELYTIYARFLKIAMSEDAVRNGHTFDLEYVNNSQHVFVFARRSRHLSETGRESLLLVAADFSQKAECADIFLPGYFFECWNLKEGEYTFTDLLSGNEETVMLRHNSSMKIRFGSRGIAILKTDL